MKDNSEIVSQQKAKQSMQIDNIIKDTIKKNTEEKKNKVKEIELK